MPLQKKAVENGNTCFIQTENLTPFTDQWMFFGTIRKVKPNKLDELYDAIIVDKRNNSFNSSVTISSLGSALPIILTNQIVLPRHGLNPLLLKYLKDNFNFMNADYLIKKQAGRSTYGTQIYFESVEEKENTVVMPRGLIRELLKHCNDQKIAYELYDKRVKLEPVNFTSLISLYDYQQEAVEIVCKKDFGVVVAPPGSGKTLMALDIVARKQQPTLIIVHLRQLFDQWVDRIQSSLNIPKFQIGSIEGGRCEIGKEITVAMIQSMQTPNLPDTEKLYHAFGTIIVDECHHIPAKTFREIIRNFHSFYLYGLTATPIRKNKDEKLIFMHLLKLWMPSVKFTQTCRLSLDRGNSG